MTRPTKRRVERAVDDLEARDESIDYAAGEPYALMVQLATAAGRNDGTNPWATLSPSERRKAAAIDYAAGGMVPYEGYREDLAAFREGAGGSE